MAESFANGRVVFGMAELSWNSNTQEIRRKRCVPWSGNNSWSKKRGYRLVVSEVVGGVLLIETAIYHMVGKAREEVR